MHLSLPEDDAPRLNALRDTHILDTPPEAAFDDIARLAIQLTGMPMAAISFVDRDRQWNKSAVGFTLVEIPRVQSICAHAIRGFEPLVIHDITEDARFSSDIAHPRSYVGVPLIDEQGYGLGALCVMDTMPREFTRDQIEAMQMLARQVMRLLELRRCVTDLEVVVGKRKHVTKLLEERNRDLMAQTEELKADKIRLEQDAEQIHEGNSVYEYASQRFLELFQGLPVACYCYDARGRIFEWNRAFETLYGFRADQVLQKAIWNTMARGDNAEQTKLMVARVFSGEAIESIERNDLRADGSICQVLSSMFPLRLPNGTIVGGICANIDITERIRAEEALRDSELRFRSLTECATDAIVTTDAAGTIVFWNKGAANMFGYHESEAAGQTVTSVVPELFERIEQTGLASTWSEKLGVLGRTVEMVGRRKNGTPIPLELSLATWETRHGRFYSGIIRDISERKQYENQLRDQMQQIHTYSAELESHKGRLEAVNAKLEALAKLDGMTGLKNHRAFQERLDIEFQRAQRYAMPLSLLLLDVDNFKPYNDTFGHPAGDEVLKSVAKILEDNARGADFVARYGGEEFVVILPHTDALGAFHLAERFRVAIEQAAWPLRAITASIGVTTLSGDIPTMSLMISEADSAMYRSKSDGRNRSTHAHEIDPLMLSVTKK